MLRAKFRAISSLLVTMSIVLSSLYAPFSQPLYAADQQTNDTPTTLIATDVYSYDLAAPKVFWHTGVPICPPGLAAADNNAANSAQAQPAAPDQANGDYNELISRIATYGGMTRQLYSKSLNCGEQEVNSNIVASSDFIYWLTNGGLMMLSTDANVGDAPQLMNALVNGYGELSNASDRVYYLTRVYNNNSQTYTSEVGYVLKSNNQLVSFGKFDGYGSNLQNDGKYLYYMNKGSLIRLNPGVDNGISIANGVGGYYPEGNHLTFCTINPFKCFFSDNVYVAKGNKVYIYNNLTNSLETIPIYTSTVGNAEVYELRTVFTTFLSGNLFIMERRPLPCPTEPCFTTYNAVLLRTGRSGGAVDALYTSNNPAFSAYAMSHLTSDGTYLFWAENGGVQRLPVDAAALPVINMRITGVEVTQGIQNLSNSVLLVKGRRTFVRVYVKSDGNAVSGVTAYLSNASLEFGSPLVPVNPVGTTITVRPSPDRNDLNQSFLFELPWSWTNQNSLTMRIRLNPYGVPLEPTYDDNSNTTAVSFSPSPKLSAEFYRLNYTIGGTTYSPRIFDDVLKTYSWIMRAYPIGGSVGTNFKPRLWDVAGGTWLGSYVNRTHPDCTAGKIGDSDLDLCASYYTNGWLKYYRDHGWVPNVTDFYYGMIADGSGNFPRGQALYAKTSVGPSGTPCSPFNLGCGWDTDGSYADWYAGHEMGHSLGRAHPSASAALCGNSASDPGYPYPNGHIGPNNGSMEGFDVGDPTFGIARRVYPGTSWNDVMSYCSNQWISDYTYKGMYDFMIANPSLVADAASPMMVNGEFLSVAGVVNPATQSGGFAMVRRLPTAAGTTPSASGDYSVRLLGGSNNVLSETSFTPNPAEDSPVQGFDLVLDFVTGTRTVQLIQKSDNKVLATQSVSAHAPTIDNVALQNASDPVSGTVTLSWNASDADGDSLTFDIFYSRDNGATLQPVQMSVTGSSAQIDTATLGGSGTAILRVVASDGVNTAEAASAPFVMAPKPPQPYILLPENNLHVHYGQLVNFSGMAFDVQDGTVADANFVWRNAKGETLATGALASITKLLVGQNIITMEATNSAGQTASAQVTVFVDDDLNLPAATLSAAPDQVSWHVTADTTQQQTAQITVNNSGSGQLDFTASSDQPWLTVSPISGTVSAEGDPITLSFTADPSGLANNQTHVAHVTIVKPESGNVTTQTVTSLVTLSIGDIFTVPAQQEVPAQSVYLPLITR
ncbi:MAG: hypothetical protein U0175_37715 [Caldilineaceae bacterium]